MKKTTSRKEAIEETISKFNMLIDNFITEQSELDQFKQNDEKLYEDPEDNDSSQ